MSDALSWKDLLVNVVGHVPPPDSLELRNSFIENTLTDQDGNRITQAPIHYEMQKALWEWESGARARGTGARGLIRAPYNTGKSQQVPIGLSAYLTTRKHETENLIISADGGISAKRIISLRALFDSAEYKYWCKQHNFQAVTIDRNDTGSTQRIVLSSKNRTGNPSFEAYAVLTRTAGQRCTYLWLDDVCNDQDRSSQPHREDVWKKVSNIWVKRVHDKGFIFNVSTPYHPDDANSRLMKSGIFNVLQIAVKPEKDGYNIKKWDY